MLNSTYLMIVVIRKPLSKEQVKKTGLVDIDAGIFRLLQEAETSAVTRR